MLINTKTNYGLSTFTLRMHKTIRHHSKMNQHDQWETWDQTPNLMKRPQSFNTSIWLEVLIGDVCDDESGSTAVVPSYLLRQWLDYNWLIVWKQIHLHAMCLRSQHFANACRDFKSFDKYRFMERRSQSCHFVTKAIGQYIRILQ